MALSPHVFDASRANFDELVLGNSHRGLVLVHFWTPKAGPCLMLMPRLVQLAADYGGRFLLVMANTDEIGGIARAHGVTSVPTVKFFLNGEVVHTIHGAEPDSTFRAVLGRFVALDSNPARQQALKAHQEGRTEEAIALLARAAVEQPDDLSISADLAKLLLLAGQPAQALNLLTALPREARHDGRIAPLLVHLELIAAADAAPDAAAPDEARFGQAARALIEDRMEAALDGLLELAQSAPEFRDDIGRRALITLFDLLGPEHELTRRYRAKLAGR
ncbi:putative thioredoxin [Sulfuritortus calidifontis]|uniref:Putative thioredoxin n=1 Tax=Sulfuritortus calidifontis TaxID=1914471 RepID=A0A4R3JXF5_9PROT|nr:tetratricopeptide repeat protein [Sulfuritortus calidifontis]TCS73078.1 putative thioredoxin [Sulfuritortus calidifontis]